MLISLNWIRDFVDLPADIDPRALAERFTVTTAEVEGVEHVACGAQGLVAGRVLSAERVGDAPGLTAVRIDAGEDTFDSVTAAEHLKAGDVVIFAPPGAVLPGVGEVTRRETAGRSSAGMVVPGDALGLTTVGQRAVWLPATTRPGKPIDPALFDDWIIEIDNKSITHRPDLWGHYGVARELAAIYRLPLRPYEVAPIHELSPSDKPEIPIVIDDPERCPRYSGLRMSGVRVQPAPLWMQTRLAQVGMRPIDLLVDLTNYIMAELSQPMHAFDAASVDRIEVATAAPGETFTTLDGVERKLPDGALMIQCNRRSVALAGIMGGAETEVTASTKELLLESANFAPAVIRRCAAALGHRTDASARFEKSLDPHNTVLGIQRFVHLARPELPELTLTSRLSDAFPHPPEPTVARVDPVFVGRYIGRPVSRDEIRDILTPLAFRVADAGDQIEVTVPSFRATKDISIEADIIEEVARFIGYDKVEPRLPTVTVRYAEPDAMGLLERRTLHLFCDGMSYAEVHRYIWFEGDWLRRLGYDPGPTIVLRNPTAAGNDRLRTTLMPGLLAAVDLNRHHIDRFELIEIGSAFFPPATADGASAEQRHLALAAAVPGRKAVHEDALFARLKTDLETWAVQLVRGHLRFEAAEPEAPWEHEAKTAGIRLEGQRIGRMTVVPAACRRRIDEHLAAWSIALAEIDLSAVVDRRPPVRKLVPVPTHPQIDVDFSVLAETACRYADIEKALTRYDHPLLRRLAFVDSYEGGSVPAGYRSFTFRATLGDPGRTLTDQDAQTFRESFIAFLEANALRLRA